MKSNPKDLKNILDARKKGKKDDRVIGLFLPGGGMRGVFSGGVMTVLEQLGYSEVFDYVYGFSAGAFSGAYLLSGNAAEGTSIYFKELSGHSFIQPWKLSDAMNLHYFCDEVVEKEKNLNLEKIKNSKTIIKIFLTEIETGKLKYFTNKDEANLIQLLKLSCAYPGYSSSCTSEMPYVDGNACHLIPISEAINDGCTDILVVWNTKPSKVGGLGARGLDVVSRLMTRKFPPKFKEEKKKAIKNYKKEAKDIYGKKSFENSNIYNIYPDIHISATETRGRVLVNFAEHGRKKAKEFFV